jgi:hypothetical protein
MPPLAEKYISSWDEFYDFVRAQRSCDKWIYRGQMNKKWLLDTTIERALRDWNIDLIKASAIEFQTIREFRRRLRDPQYDRARTDTLFCLALMQHYGAPTRLLDCTYSPYAAAAFAMEKGPSKTPAVWCFRGRWLEEEARNKTPHKDFRPKER